MLLFPVQNQKPAEKHSSQVGEMSDASAHSENSGNKLYSRENKDEPFGFQRNRRENQRKDRIREKHGITYQDSIYGS